ncbi:MAG: flagellar hook-length control protein FliK [Phycisphaerales bacterium]
MLAAPAGTNPSLVQELIGSLAAPQAPTPTDFAAFLAERRSPSTAKQPEARDEPGPETTATSEEPAPSDKSIEEVGSTPDAAGSLEQSQDEAPDATENVDPGETLERSHTQELTRDYSLAERAAQELSTPKAIEAANEGSETAPAQPTPSRRVTTDGGAQASGRPSGPPQSERAGTSGVPSTSTQPAPAAAAHAGAAAAGTVEGSTRPGHSQIGTVGAAGGTPRFAGQARPSGAQAGQPVAGVSTGKGGSSVGAGQATVGAKEVLARIGGKSGQPQVLKTEVATAAHAARVIVQGMREGRTDVVMRLRPESLGPVRIELSIQDERVSARIEAATPAAHELLTESLDHLRSALEARGLSVAGLDVVLAAEPREHTVAPHADPDADRRGSSGGHADPGQEDPGGRRRSDDGATAEPWGTAGAAEPAGAWISRGEDGLAVVRLDTTI